MEKQLSTVKEALVLLDSHHGEITNQQVAIEANVHSHIDRLHEILEVRRTSLIDVSTS